MNQATGIETPESILAPDAFSRSQLYRSLGEWTRFPLDGFHRDAVDGNVGYEARLAIEALPYQIDSAEEFLSVLSRADPDYTNFQSSYVCMFDVGAGGAPCPLYAGAWKGDRQSSMEEALRFYRYFGLRVSGEDELPDHLPNELEFLHYLTFKESQSDPESAEAAPLRRGARDFLCRHVTAWLTPAAERIQTLNVPEFWGAMVGLTQAFCAADAKYLVGLEGPPAE